MLQHDCKYILFHYKINDNLKEEKENLSKKIVSTGDGEVTFAGIKGGYGRTIIVRPTAEFKSLYAHLSKISVKKGDKLEKGDIIGLMGNSGRSTGIHLHYEIMKKEDKINPRNYLEAI